MKKVIVDVLKQLEERENIKILFAVENGSRVWNMASKDSDYDVRFVFCRPLKDYIRLTSHSEVINAAYDENLQPCEVHGSMLDMSGFDIFKYLKLLSGSNPTAIEWLMSPMVYWGNNDVPLRQYVQENFNPEKLFYHYYGLFKRNYLDDFVAEREITYKRYLYAMRGILNAEYVAGKLKIPPLDFRQTVEESKASLPEDVYAKLSEVIEIKASGKEKDAIGHVKPFDDFFAEKINMIYTGIVKKEIDQAVFDAFLQDCLHV
uniref:Nucleotidyltransferase n=1 Tax=uncultured Alphaproteobacteria bacterium TaxID=91750 RepID=A0A6G8F329_9PROT|nr:hypothetical protein PlAlph_6020 [uncultured Alphaproteobacteria bacterium]